MKKFNNNLFFEVQRQFLARTGDPTGTGKGGQSALSVLSQDGTSSYVKDEFSSKLKMNQKGLVCLSNKGVPDTNSSQLFITLRDNELEHLDEKHTIVGKIVEGYDELEQFLNNLYVDENFRPLQDIRILHTYILDDPFDNYTDMNSEYDSPNEDIPSEETVTKRIQYGAEVSQEATSPEEAEKENRKKEARSRAEVLEMVGDLPDADIKAPENVLFVCKLNPITTDDDLELLFSRFGEIKECEIIKDRDSGESLQYAFIEFMTAEQCNQAYLKMNNVIVDDRRIKVDFSQSVAKIWNKWTMQPKKQSKRART